MKLTPDELKKIVFDVVQEQLKPVLETQKKYMESAPAMIMSPKEDVDKGIRFARQIKSILLAKSRGITQFEAAKVLYPRDAILHDGVKMIMEKSAQSETLDSTGGYLVFPQFSSEMIELLRAATIVRKAGASTLVLNGVLNIPKQTSGASFAYVGENTNISPSLLGFGQITLSPKKLVGLVPISNDLLRDNSLNADQIVRDDMIQGFARAEDIAFIRYDGTQAKPKGIYYWVNSNNKLQANQTVSLANVAADLAKAIIAVIGADIPMVRPCWLMAPRSWSYLYNVMNSNGQYVYRSEMDQGRLCGYPFFLSTQIPINLSANGHTDNSEVYFGDMSQFIIGDSDSITIDASQEAAYFDGSSVVASFSLDQTAIRGIARHDCALRHDYAFSILYDVRWGV